MIGQQLYFSKKFIFIDNYYYFSYSKFVWSAPKSDIADIREGIETKCENIKAFVP